MLRLAELCVGVWFEVLDARTVVFNPGQSSQGWPSRVSRLPACWRWWRPWWTRSAWWPCPACTPASARPSVSRKGRDPVEDGTIEDKWYIFFIFQPLYLVSGEAASFRGCTTCTVSKKKKEKLRIFNQSSSPSFQHLSIWSNRKWFFASAGTANHVVRILTKKGFLGFFRNRLILKEIA